MALLARLRDEPLAWFAAGAATFGLISTLYSVSRTPAAQQTRANTFPSPPRASLDTAILPYPPDALDNARLLSTPYGDIQTYEFGPADSTRKLLLVHGISSSSIALHALGRSLASLGCRVTIIDLFGRGWSGGPSDLPYDSRLYSTQLLLALAHSPISWFGPGTTGQGAFTLVGYSLGGGIAADFTSWFPELVEDLVLLAPGGLQRWSDQGCMYRLMYGGWLPRGLVYSRIERMLVGPAVPVERNGGRQPGTEHEKKGAAGTQQGVGEVAGKTEEERAGSGGLWGAQKTARETVAWQIRENKGFMNAFVSSIKHAPVIEQQERWRLIGARMTAATVAAASAADDARVSAEAQRQGLRSGKVLIIFGATDPIVRPAQVGADARAVLGDENVTIRAVDAGHDLPWSHTPEIVGFMKEHLRL